jgi:geranylgeranyl diphosphate synthase, type II
MDFITPYISSLEKYFLESSLIGSPDTLYEPMRYLLSIGGKRMRPALTLMAYHLYKDDVEYALPAAYAVEVFHNFTLMHDDIMDHANTRRGQSTVHKKYDVNAAILSGDAMLIKAYELITNYPDSQGIALVRVFNKMAIELCEGQRLDMDFETKSDVTIAEYLRMVEYKTAVLLAYALQQGAILANAPSSDGYHLFEFGKNLGISFQIQDDILDTFGEGAKVGKKIGGDIIQNKKTYLYLKTLEIGGGSELNVLSKFYDPHYVGTEDDKIQSVKNAFISSGAAEYANQVRDAYHDLAMSHLAGITVDSNKKKALISLADFLIKRDK